MLELNQLNRIVSKFEDVWNIDIFRLPYLGPIASLILRKQFVSVSIISGRSRYRSTVYICLARSFFGIAGSNRSFSGHLAPESTKDI